MGMTEVISMLLQREEIEKTDINHQAVVDFVMDYKDILTGQASVMKRYTRKRHLDIKDARDMRVVIEESVSNNLPDIARWLLKTSGYLVRACSASAALGVSKNRFLGGKKHFFQKVPQ